METLKYRHLLASLSEQLTRNNDANTARVAAKWLRECQDIDDSTESRRRFITHALEVRRAGFALVTLAQERASPKLTPDASNVLESTLNELIAEANRMHAELKRMDAVIGDRGLEMIVGEYLSSVAFVMDYVQLQFCDHLLTANTSPSVHIHQSILKFGEEGYRDALCGLIGATVKDTKIREMESLEIVFSDEKRLSISLRGEDRVGPEAAIFWSHAGGCWVW